MTQPRLVGGRYELGELIGYGGMAEVHRGRDVRLGRDVAIKVLRADLARDPSFLNRFRREAQSAAGLNHPSIVSVYDTGEDVAGDGTAQPYIVMEFVEGRTLRDILKAEGRLPARRAMEIIADVSAALDFSHRAGLVHRDVKPANVMITQAGAVKVMDFGIARALADNSSTVTQTANVIGTAQYLSPEQARGENVDARSDVYSTGCLLYELITGVPPFQGDSPVAVAYQHVRENPAMPSSRVPGLPRALDSIVMKALAKNPQNRYQSAGEMRSDLQRALANQPVSAESVMTDAERTQFIARTPPPPVVLATRDGDDADHDRERRNAIIWVAIVVALLLVVGIGAFVIWRMGSNGSDTKKIAVPNLVGLSVHDANKQLGNKPNCSAQNNCTVFLVPNSENPTTSGPCDDNNTPDKENVICKVTDQAGSKVPANADVTEGSTLLYSLYKKDLTGVPYVKGNTFGQAVDLLQNAQLKAKQGKPINTFDYPAGQVAAQSPNYNKQVPPGTVVTLHLSTGKEKLPDVTNMKVGDARAKLNSAQFLNIGPDRTKNGSDQAKDGLVVGMDPTPGNAYQANVRIRLTVYNYVQPQPTCDSNPVTPPATPVTSTSVDPTTSATVTTTTTPTPTPTTSNGLPPC
jgi:serine/threonine-protein kinase